jgi:hypothetical protein
MFSYYLIGDFENINFIVAPPENGHLFKIKDDICDVHLVNPSHVNLESIRKGDNYLRFVSVRKMRNIIVGKNIN